MNELVLPFFKAVSTVNAGVFNRDILIRHAIALAVSDLSPLPSAPVENVEISFNNFARLRAEALIADFNEITPLNIANVMNLVRAYWIARYRIAFGTHRVFVGSDYLDIISGLSSALSPDELKTLNESSGDMGFLYDAARSVVENLSGNKH